MNRHLLFFILISVIGFFIMVSCHPMDPVIISEAESHQDTIHFIKIDIDTMYHDTIIVIN